MRVKMKNLIAIFLSVVILMSLVACGGGTTEQGGSQSGSSQPGTQGTASGNDTLRIIIEEDPGTFDPGYSDNQTYYQTTRQIYEPLFRINNDGTLENWLCESYEYDDETTLLIRLRDVKFSNGDPLTSEDVLWSYRRLKEDALPVPQVNGILLDKCEIVSDRELRIYTDGVQASLLSLLAYPGACIGSKKAYAAANGDYLDGAAIGTGPYALNKYFIGDRAEFSANEYYWRQGEPYTKNLMIRYLGDNTSRGTEAKAKGADIIISINNRDIEAVDAVNGMHVLQELSASTTYLMLNSTKAPLDNPKVREAVTYAININQTIGMVYPNFGSPATGMVCPGILGYDEGIFNKHFGSGYDPEKAKALLTEAGYPDGITLEIAVSATDRARMDIAEAFQAQMASAGINLDINGMTTGLSTYVSAGDKHQMAIYGLTCFNFEADGMLNQLLPGSFSVNITNYRDQTFLDLVAKGSETLDKTEREQAWKEALDNLGSAYVVIPLWHKALVAAVSDNVEGFYLTRDYEEHYYQTVTLK